MSTAIAVEHVSKVYRLGAIGVGTLADDLTRWWGRLRRQSRRGTIIGDEQRQRRDGDTFWALRDVSFEVEQGSVLGIIGRNGAGKSTLLKILSRVTGPTSGEIKIRGRISSLLEVGTGFHPELTGRENVFLNGAILGMTKAEIRSRFDEIVAFAEIADHLDTPVKRYSSGMYVRLAFAVAAHLEPDTLIVDEVLAVGDASFQRKCLGKMQDVAGHGRTVLFVSHSMAAVQALCAKTLVLSEGRPIFNGDTARAVAMYLGDKQANTGKNVAERTDREGNGAIRFTGVDVARGGGQNGRVVQSGDPITITLSFQRHRPVARPTFYLGIYDPLGIQLVHLNTKTADDSMWADVEKGTVTCRIPRLPLPPGRYSLTAAVTEPGEMLDRVEGAEEVIVEAGDFYGTGSLAGTEVGRLLVDHSWSMDGPTRS